MKRICFLLLFSLFVAVKSFGVSISDDGQKSKAEIILTTRQDIGKSERSADGDIQAFYYSQLSVVEINCSDEGNVAVYLFNSRNKLCGYTEFDSSVTSFERLDVPKESGTYHIAIITDRSYSEGTFTK